MEKVEARLKRFKDWLYFYKHLSLLKDKSGKRIYNTTQSLFSKRILSSGIEGIVYKTTFTNKTRYKYNFLGVCDFIFLLSIVVLLG